MAPVSLSVRFDGIADLPRLSGQGDLSWRGSGPARLDAYHLDVTGFADPDMFAFSGSFAGQDWRIETLRLTGGADAVLNLRDEDTGTGRSVESLVLGGTSDVDLRSTQIGHVLGLTSTAHDITLGQRNTQSITLMGQDNHVTTGAGFVGAITTFSLSLHSDVIVIGAGGARAVATGAGDDRVSSGSGYVEYITTGQGNDIVTLGEGGNAFILTGDGDDTVHVAPLAVRFGVAFKGGDGVDTLDFRRFADGITFSLDERAAYQNVTNPNNQNPPETTRGFFSEAYFENIIATNENDAITGDKFVNHLRGRDGNDILHGRTGHDTLHGGYGNDRLYGEGGQDLLLGGKGRDVLAGGRGNDEMRGHGGRDVFVFGALSGTDTIRDFNSGDDVIRLIGHEGGFEGLRIVDQGSALRIVHDGGVILLSDLAGAQLSAQDFDFI